MVTADTHQHPTGATFCWYAAGVPWWWHICRAHCSSIVDHMLVERCACGAIRGTDVFTGVTTDWTHRNERRIQARGRSRHGVV